MKRVREEMEKGSSEIIRSAIQELSLLKPEGPIPTGTFLNVCNLLLQFLDKIGPTMMVLRQDVQQNIQRLEEIYESDPSFYSNLIWILKREVGKGTPKKKTSCARALVWLTRSLDFTAALFDKLTKEPDWSLEQVVEESYSATLTPWHGWISSAAYKVALKLVPGKQNLHWTAFSRGRLQYVKGGNPELGFIASACFERDPCHAEYISLGQAEVYLRKMNTSPQDKF